MSLEINLLGQREKRNLAPYLILAVIAILVVILGIAAFMWNSSANSELTRIEQKLQSTQQLIQVYEQQSGNEAASTAVDDLMATIQWVETFPAPTVLFIRHLTGLLPERGYIMNFSYSDDGALSLVVQTDTNREMAYFLKALLDSPFITEANLTSMSTTTVTPESDVDEDSVETDEYLPRYTGQFQIQVDKGALKAHEEMEGAES